jgi:hydroxymethylpyrimidine pyrophosphatase-like HAD family hydrolase
LPKFKKNPTPILQILETLKDDPEEYVRRSVANNLNDISKDNPDVVLDICEKWFGENANRDWIVKHACRTLLKAGNKRALMLFGFGDPRHIEISDLEFTPQTLAIGDELYFSFKITKRDRDISRLRLEYAVNFVKANNKYLRKIFQIKEADFDTGSYSIKRKHSFKDLSTRKHYPGPHQFTIIVNGVEKATGMVKLEKST